MIAILVPTRGLPFAEVMEAIEREREGYDTKLYFEIGKRIPDCHNNLTERALADGASHLFYVEDDTVPPKGALEKLLAAEGDISAIDYAVNGWGCITRDKINSEIVWCGLGCTLVKSSVFKELEKPYFRDDMQLMANEARPDFKTWVPAPKNRYGGEDVWFCMKALEKGFKIVQVQGECKHLKLDGLGVPEENNGAHKISEKPKIEKHQFI